MQVCVGEITPWAMGSLQSSNHILYIIAEAERKWIPTIKEVVTNRKKRPLEMLPRIQL